VHYTNLLPQVQQKTGAKVSLRTLRRYGKEELGATKRKGKKEQQKRVSAHRHERVLAAGRCSSALLTRLCIVFLLFSVS
jgi:hypothetical protein